MQPTRLAYGTWSGGRFMHFGESLDEDRYCGVIRHAYEKGVRTFMSADVYGNGAADKMLGEALDGLQRDTYCLTGIVGHDFYNGKRDGSKGYPRFTNPELRGPDQYEDFLRFAVEKSLANTRSSYFDLLMLHNPDWIGYSDEKVWEAMAKLKDEGLALSLGVAPGPANGFTLDLIQCMEKFKGLIDWAMIILNPVEPWPGNLCLKAAEEAGVKVITRVVDHGGIFHDDVKPGHHFRPGDHRAFRPAGWVEAGCEKLEKMRPIANKHGITPLHLACLWNMEHPAVESVIPTFIQEAGPDARPIESKIDEYAQLPEGLHLSEDEVAEITQIGNNVGCMPLKGATRQYQGSPQADQWQTNEELESIAERWKIDPDKDIFCSDDPRDLREKGMKIHGVTQTLDRRLFLQLQVFTGITNTDAVIAASRASGLEQVIYAGANDPQSVGVLTIGDDPSIFTGAGRDFYRNDAFASAKLLPEYTMFGRTYALGHEPDLKYWLLEHARSRAMNPSWPWAVWYPLRRKGEFYRLPQTEQSKILREHGMIGFQYGSNGYAGDIRLECFGMDPNDNEFVIGIVGPRLDWLSKLIKDMRPTRQTAEYLEKLGPFFVGKVIHQSGL